MIEPPFPKSEKARLETLRSLNVLDSLPEERFDRLTRLAARLFDVPIALVSLVDAERQWFKSRFGLDAAETPRSISFCGHAILGDKVFVVSNALDDPRFADNPLVTGGPKIRFYAGAPLSSLHGHKVGTLCVISPSAREVSGEERDLLADLAAIVEQELISAELSQARDAALAASRAKSQFLANMSHEIRTPLNAVIGLSELLREARLEPQYREFVETIHTSGKSLLSLIDDILDLSKIESGKFELAEETFSIKEAVEDVRRLTEALAGDKALTVASSLDAGLPANVVGDRTRFRQALLNLTGNAVKFTHEGEIRITVEDGGRDGGKRRIRVTVSDTGIGMNEEALGKIFSRFVQADASTTRRYGGTGLGLAISRQLVELMGGTLRVESREGKGTAFTLEIPFQEGAARVAKKSAAALSGARILAVDDNTINLKVLLFQLKKMGHTGVGVSSGEAALAAAAEGGFDLILMDLQMPGIGGLETTRRLRGLKGSETVPVVALTASAFEEDRKECLAAGLVDFVSKPVQFADLKEVIEKNLR